jgi:hypothetical protein
MSWLSSVKRALRIGTKVHSATNKSIPYIDADGKLAQDNTNLKWDHVSNYLSTSRIITGQGAAGVPSIAIGDGDSGFYEFADDVLRMEIAGASMATFDANGILASNGARLLDETASNANPVFIPDNLTQTAGLGGTGGTAALIADSVGLLTADTGVANLGNVGASNLVHVESDGDMWFEGGAGLSFAQIHGQGVTDSITSVAQNDYDQITGFATDTGENGYADADHTNDHITVTKDGVYLIWWTWSGFSSTAAVHTWAFYLRTNNGTADLLPIHRIETKGSSQYDGFAGMTIASLTANDTVELWIRRFSAGANINFTGKYMALGAIQIGG